MQSLIPRDCNTYTHMHTKARKAFHTFDRLPFGMSSAPGIWHETTEQLLLGTPLPSFVKIFCFLGQHTHNKVSILTKSRRDFKNLVCGFGQRNLCPRNANQMHQQHHFTKWPYVQQWESQCYSECSMTSQHNQSTHVSWEGEFLGGWLGATLYYFGHWISCWRKTDSSGLILVKLPSVKPRSAFWQLPW